MGFLLGIAMGVGQGLTKGGGGVWTPPFLADIICEQPLRLVKLLRRFVTYGWDLLQVVSFNVVLYPKSAKEWSILLP